MAKLFNFPEIRPCYILGHDKSKTKALFHCWTTLDDGMHGTKTAAIVEFVGGERWLKNLLKY